MLAKPNPCVGCPMYQDGIGFVPDEIINGAEVFVLGQNPGEDEEREGRPFVGKSGMLMDSIYLPAGGLQRGLNVSIGNVVRCRWNKTNKLPSAKILAPAMALCTREYLRIPGSVRLIVAQGALAAKMVAQDQKLSITDWRGFLIPNKLEDA